MRLRRLAPWLVTLIWVLAACGGDDGTPDGGGSAPALLAFGSSDRTITLAWTLPSATGYTLERKGAGGDYAPVATLSAETSSYLDTGVAPTEHGYRLREIGDSGPGLEATAAPSDEPALRTSDEPLLGAPIAAQVDASGASLTLDDGITVRLPPGAVPDATQVELARFVSPVGDTAGVEVAVSAPLAAPLRISFPYDVDDEPGNLAVVHKQADGTWVSRPFELDVATRSVTLVVTPELVAGRLAAGGGSRTRALVLRARAIEPRRAVIPPGSTLRLVAYAHFTDYPCDRDTFAGSVGCTMIALAIDPHQVVRPVRETRHYYANVVAGYERDWLVNGALGGNPTVGHIVAAPVGADYLAPAAAPPTNPVDVSFTSVRVDGATRTPAPPLRAAITVANPRWRGSLSCVVSATGTGPIAGGTRTETRSSTITATAEDALVPSTFSMTITSAQGSYTRTVVSDTEIGTTLCPVHHRSEYVETSSLSGATASDLVALVVDDQRGEYMLTSGFGANLIGAATLTNTYTASGDPALCPPPPPNSVEPRQFTPFWSCGGSGTFPPGSNRILVDATVHDQQNPPGTTHYRYDFTRQ